MQQAKKENERLQHVLSKQEELQKSFELLEKLQAKQADLLASFCKSSVNAACGYFSLSNFVSNETFSWIRSVSACCFALIVTSFACFLSKVVVVF